MLGPVLRKMSLRPQSDVRRGIFRRSPVRRAVRLHRLAMVGAILRGKINIVFRFDTLRTIASSLKMIACIRRSRIVSDALFLGRIDIHSLWVDE